MSDEQKKKVIIDEDWKQQAKKEKEALKAEEEAAKVDSEKAGIPHEQPMPPGDFSTLVSILATQAFVSLGVFRTEETKEDKDFKPNLPMAKFHIDLLTTLEEKTKGNLSEDEQKVLTDTLNQLRMAFVTLSSQK